MANNLLREQYLDLKALHPDCIVLFQIGDYYEAYEQDGEIVARICDLEYGKDRKQNYQYTMFPLHALNQFVEKLTAAGYRVAQADQIGENGKRLIERKVTAIHEPISGLSKRLIHIDPAAAGAEATEFVHVIVGDEQDGETNDASEEDLPIWDMASERSLEVISELIYGSNRAAIDTLADTGDLLNEAVGLCKDERLTFKDWFTEQGFGFSIATALNYRQLANARKNYTPDWGYVTALDPSEAYLACAPKTIRTCNGLAGAVAFVANEKTRRARETVTATLENIHDLETRTVAAAIASATLDTIDTIATTGAVAVNGESQTANTPNTVAAVLEGALEGQKRRGQHIADHYQSVIANMRFEISIVYTLNGKIEQLNLTDYEQLTGALVRVRNQGAAGIAVNILCD